MMRERLAEAIQLRETGRAKQDQAMLEEARTLLLELVAVYPDEAEITYQTAIVALPRLKSYCEQNVASPIMSPDALDDEDRGGRKHCEVIHEFSSEARTPGAGRRSLS